MTDSKPRQKRAYNREATQKTLLDACETILLRDGPEGIRVNNVVAEAGVGKDLIYRYFGGLPGLIQAWLKQDSNWPTIDELTASDTQHFDQLEMPEQVKTICKNYVSALRNRPVIMRILVSEIMQPTDVTAIMEEAGDRIGRDLYQSLHLSGMEISNDVVDVALIFTTMANYLCMRASTSPNAFGMDLQDEASWERILNIMSTLIERYLYVPSQTP
jgi:AcrR family transcriptional regulator